VGVLAPGQMMLMYGSTIFTVEVTRDRVRDPRLWWAPWLFRDQHASLAGLATSGTLTHWFREQFGRELDAASAMAALAEEAAASPPGANGLVFLPYFSGERTPIHDPRAKGSWFGLTLAHTRADMYRALLEGIACGTRHAMETYAQAGASPTIVRAVGGGVRNALWLQATSDHCGVRQQVTQATLGASLGDAFLAALAIGNVRLNDIEKWNPVSRDIVPDVGNAEVYRRQYEVFRELYTRNRDLMAKLG
jgi:xylulokinase